MGTISKDFHDSNTKNEPVSMPAPLVASNRTIVLLEEPAKLAGKAAAGCRRAAAVLARRVPLDAGHRRQGVARRRRGKTARKRIV